MADGNINIGMASFADTGQWRLIVGIRRDGISAVFKNALQPDSAPVIFFKNSWNPAASDVLTSIEEAVFNNPRMLDDFATQIVIETDRALWIPSVFSDEEDFDPALFTTIYPAEPENIFADYGQEEICLYTLVPGLNSFLSRTLPGCKTLSHLSVLKQAFEKMETEAVQSDVNPDSLQSVYVNIDNPFADIFLFKNGKFLCGTSHSWRELSDVAYKIMLSLKAYDFRPESVNLHLISSNGEGEATAEILKDFIPSARYLSTPYLTSERRIPLGVALTAGENLVSNQL